MKLLTIAVPAYNAEKTLRTCLDSFLEPSALPLLDIIVVNDGSRDATGAIAREYVQRYPDSFRVLDKENGGHGSGINAAVKRARGNYFRVVDADDWLVTSSLVPLLDALRDADADAVLTHFRTVQSDGKVLREFRTAGLALNREYDFADFWAAGKGVRPCCCFHGLCYRTDFYKACNISLSEKIFYEDQEYAALPFKGLKSILPLDIFLYQYMLGSAEQSVSGENQVKNIDHLEKVFWVIWEQYKSNPQLPRPTREYFIFKLSEQLLFYYSAALLRNPDKKTGPVMARSMRKEVREKDPLLHRSTARKYLVTMALHYSGVTGSRWAALRNLPLYKHLRKLIY